MTLINEKRLCKLLKKVHKETGYKIVQIGDTTIIDAEGILVRVASEAIPRQLLGMLMEHVGEIPRACAVQVMAKRENQTMLPEVAVDMTVALENPREAEITPITWEGCLRVYQCRNGQTFEIYEYQRELLNENALKPVVDLERRVAVWQGEEEELVVPIITKKENVHLSALESHRWTP